MTTRHYRILRDAYVITEVDVDESGVVVGSPRSCVQTYDDYALFEDLDDGREISRASFPASVDWPVGMPLAAGTGVSFDVSE